MSEAATPSEVFRRLVHAVEERRQSEIVDECYAEDVIVEHPFMVPEPTVTKGREELRKRMTNVQNLPVTIDVSDIVVHETTDPEVVVGEFQSRITSKQTESRSRPAISWCLGFAAGGLFPHAIITITRCSRSSSDRRARRNDERPLQRSLGRRRYVRRKYGRDLVKPGIKTRDRERFRKEWRGIGARSHPIIVVRGRPLCVHRHLGAVQTAVKSRGDESRNVTDARLGSARQQLDEPRLFLWRDGEDVDDRHRAVALCNPEHGTIREGTRLSLGQTGTFVTAPSPPALRGSKCAPRRQERSRQCRVVPPPPRHNDEEC